MAYLEASSLDGQFLQRNVAYGKLSDLKQKAGDKVGMHLKKAEEERSLREKSRYLAEIESRNMMMMNRGMPYDRMSKQDQAQLKPLVEEVVAEFLKKKRQEAAKTPQSVEPPPKNPAENAKP